MRELLVLVGRARVRVGADREKGSGAGKERAAGRSAADRARRHSVRQKVWPARFRPLAHRAVAPQWASLPRVYPSRMSLNIVLSSFRFSAVGSPRILADVAEGCSPSPSAPHRSQHDTQYFIVITYRPPTARRVSTDAFLGLTLGRHPELLAERP